MDQTTDTPAAGPPDHFHKNGADGGVLPPYSGEETPCTKCSHHEAYTRYRLALSRLILVEWNGESVYRGNLPERLERECKRCDYTWDEALCPPGCGMTVEALAHAVDNAAPYPIDLAPEVCKFMARYLLECLHIAARPEHPLWQYDDGRPAHLDMCEVPHPTTAEEEKCERRRAPQPQTPPADSKADG